MKKDTLDIDCIRQIDLLLTANNTLFLIGGVVLFNGKFYLNKSFNFLVNKKYPVKKKIALNALESLLPITISVIEESKERLQIFNI